MHSRASIELLCLQWLGVDGLTKLQGAVKSLSSHFEFA
jgi:hypothetical protein